MKAVWQQIQQLITNVTDAPFVITEQSSVSGGDVNQAYCISDGKIRYFVKLNDAAVYAMFEQEAKGLVALAQCQQMAVPKVIGFGATHGVSYLVLEHFDFAPRCDEVSFAKALALLHLSHGSQQQNNQQYRNQFGFDEDNYIGRTVQINTWHDNWGEFFTQCRLKPQLDILRKQGKGARWMDKLERRFADVSDFLNQHHPQPALLHGDLWQGNYGTLTDGRPTLYDPAVYYGDSETDLAMMMLFGCPSDDFFTAYFATHRQIKPITAGFEQRRVVYNLYHILNHANLFGDSYLYQAEGMAGEVLG